MGAPRMAGPPGPFPNGRFSRANKRGPLGVGASRWAAGIARDFILRPGSDLLGFASSVAAGPFPPEPLRSLVVETCATSSPAPTRTAGRRGLLLRTLDALGIGFDS